MRVILFTGRGGSGVSMVAAATAAALAKGGQRTLAFGLGSGLGDALGAELTHEVSEIAPGLFALEAGHGQDEPDEFRDWLEDLLDWRGIEPELAEDLELPTAAAPPVFYLQAQQAGPARAEPDDGRARERIRRREQQ